MNSSYMMSNDELQMMISTLDSDINNLTIEMQKNPANRKNIDELVISYNMYMSCLGIAKSRNINIPSFNTDKLKKIQRELIKYDILTEEEYMKNGELGEKHI